MDIFDEVELAYKRMDWSGQEPIIVLVTIKGSEDHVINDRDERFLAFAQEWLIEILDEQGITPLRRDVYPQEGDTCVAQELARRMYDFAQGIREDIHARWPELTNPSINGTSKLSD